MKKSDVIELIKVDMPDNTTGAFDVRIESDDGGVHIVIAIEDHTHASFILDAFSARFTDHRILVLKVPEDSLHCD
jgi:hypothetical protein